MSDEIIEPSIGPIPADQEQAIESDLSLGAQHLRELEQSVEGLEKLYAELTVKRDEIEQREQERAKTPLALRLEVVSCEYCSVIFPANQTIPEFRFDTVPCPFGKERPDQDCRDCAHVRFIPYGSVNLQHHEKRYASHGMVIPIKDENEADEIATKLHEMNITPLRRVAYEIKATEKALETAKRNADEAKAREIERHQRGDL